MQLPNRSRRRPGAGKYLLLAASFLLGAWLLSEKGSGLFLLRETSQRPSSTTSTVTVANTSPSVSLVTVVQSTRPLTAAEQLAEKHDSRTDNWDTELISEAVVRQLDQLADLLETPKRIDDHAVQPLVADDVIFHPLRPTPLADVYQNGPIRVSRPTSPTKTPSTHAGAKELTKSVLQLAAALGPGEHHRRVKFKLFQIEKQEERLRTRVYYQASNNDSSGCREQNATWLCDWTYSGSAMTQPPRMTGIEVEQYEEVRNAIPGGKLLVDCTKSVLAGNAAYARQVIPGINHWLNRIPKEFIGQFGHHGLAVGDVNGDELDDLYACDAGGLPNRLYIQRPDGTATDVSDQSGVNLLEDSVGALLIDIDNDADQDLIVATDPFLQIAENDGRGRFSIRSAFHVQTDPFSLCAADFDRDGDLDIYVCGYKANKQDPDRGLPFPWPYHDANNGGKNYLLRNDGDFRFVDVTRPTGLDVNNTRFSMAAAWEDFDNDGDIDLYVANDFGRNNLYRNEGGHFTDVAASAGVEDHASGMSVTWGDANRDGLMDLYVSNMFSAAGNRVAYQRRFADGLADDTVSHLRRMARGNTLFLNLTQTAEAAVSATSYDGPPRPWHQKDGESTGSVAHRTDQSPVSRNFKSLAEFRDISEQAGVTMGRWAWASKFVDLNNDGWQDLVVANGYVTNDDSGDL